MQYTIKDLMARYNLKTRQSVYQWCNGLELTMHKGENNRTFLTQDQVDLLDQLKAHLDKGGSIASFTPIDTVLDSSIETCVNSTIDTPVDWLEMIGAIASAISPPNPIGHWDRLYLAAQRRYILSTKEVHALAGAKPHGQSWNRGAFTFTRQGKVGGQTGWMVSIDSPKLPPAD